jgi:hypothetical protein
MDLVITVLLFTGVFCVIETVAPAEPNQPATKRLFNTAYYLFLLACMLLSQLMFALIYGPVSLAAAGWVLPRVIPAPRGLLVQLLFGFSLPSSGISGNTHCIAYSTHGRCSGKHTSFIPARLRSTRVRRAGTIFCTRCCLPPCICPYLFFFGWLAPHAVFTFILFRLLGLVNHANVRLHLGPLTVIVSNPQRHRIHHSLSPQHHDKNFAAFLSFLSI